MVARETVAHATIGGNMPKFMKSLNNISRAQSVFRAGAKIAEDLLPHHHGLMLFICKYRGCMQDEIARSLCLNKSTVARMVSYLEEKGYLRRESDSQDKRCLYIYPTERAEAVMPLIRDTLQRWYEKTTEGISEEELTVFTSVLSRIEENAKKQLEI